MYNYNYGTDINNFSYALNSSNNSGVWTLFSLLLAIIGAFIIYFLFVNPEKKYSNKFVNWLRRFLNFQEMLIEPILKIAYIFLALFVTLASFSLIGINFLSFLMILVFGNLVIRVIYELSMILIGIWQNTRDINKKMK